MYNIIHIAISVKDINKSIEFYKLFGFKIIKEWYAEDSSVNIVHLDNNGLIIEIFNYKHFQEMPNQSKNLETDLVEIGVKHFAFSVNNINAAYDELLNLGVINDTVKITKGRLGKSYFFIKDPDEILIEIIEKWVMDLNNFTTIIKLSIQEDLNKLLPIASLQYLKELSIKIESKLLEYCYTYTLKYSNVLLKSVSKSNFTDFIIDDNGNSINLSITNDIFNSDELIIAFIIDNKTKYNNFTCFEFDLKNTGKYKHISIMIPEIYLVSSLVICEFYKNIIETVYEWYKFQVLEYVNQEEVSVSKRLYSYMKSILNNSAIFKNFWFAIIGNGFGFRLLDYDLVYNSFEIIDENVLNYGSYTNKLVSELLTTRLPTDKMLMQIAVDNNAIIIGELDKASYTIEGSIYSTTLYSLYGGNSFVINPVYISDYNLIALYPVDLKEQIDTIIEKNKVPITNLIREEMNNIIKAYKLFNNKRLYADIFNNDFEKYKNMVLSILYKVRTTISEDAGFDLYTYFKSEPSFNKEIFDVVIKILLDNRYITIDFQKNYLITQAGITLLNKEENMDNNNNITATNIFNISGGEIIGGNFGNVTYNNSQTELDKLLNELTIKICQSSEQNKEQIIAKLDELKTEIHSQNPQKNKILNILDYLSKISSISGLIIKISELLKV